MVLLIFLYVKPPILGIPSTYFSLYQHRADPSPLILILLHNPHHHRASAMDPAKGVMVMSAVLWRLNQLADAPGPTWENIYCSRKVA